MGALAGEQRVDVRVDGVHAFPGDDSSLDVALIGDDHGEVAVAVQALQRLGDSRRITA